MKFFLMSLMVAGSALAADPAKQLSFKAVNVDTNIQIGYGVAVGDVDGDKKPDILLQDKKQLVWYRNPNWEKFVIVENLTPQDHVCLAVQDIDGDGKAEIAAGAGWNPGDTLNSGSVHYLIAPSDRTKKWESVKLPNEPTVHRMRWVKNWEGDWELVVVPLHGRGNKGGKGDGVKILAYSKPANPKDEWETRVLNDDLHMTHNFDVVQWDDDEAQELLVASKKGSFLLNWDGSALALTKLGGEEGGGAGEIRLGKAKSEKFIAAIEPMHGNSVVIYTPGSVNGPWNRKVIDESIMDGHAVAAGDLLKTGYDQLVVGWRAMNRPGGKVGIKLYEPKNGSPGEWNIYIVDDNTMACEDLVLADLNADGKLDIIAAGRATKNLKVYLNQN